MTESDSADGYVIRTALLLPYTLIGSRVSKLLPFFESLRVALEKADLKISLPIYTSYMLFFSGVTFSAAFSVTLVVTFLLRVALQTSLLLALAFGGIALGSTFAALYSYPFITCDSRSRHLDEELPYISVHMAVLSQAGLPPERIFRSVMAIGSQKLQSVASEEARNIVRDVTFLGSDIMSAMERNAAKSSSRKFSELLRGLVSVTRSGGDMTRYFLSAAKNYMDNARIASRQLSESLGNISELYVSMMVVFPLVVVIMLAVMGVMSGSLGGVSIIMIMYLVSYIAVPMMAMIVLVFLDGLMPPR